ncbi:MAG: hypothetical protein DI628_01065 [Blastochloris viridis]|uniref:Nudix hydrolase domain-containing protein n=1 Tax=Blastochloris viridis TaxID=1079 RepID=A0A6N4RD73_BLAVI|nr:MAG: hypothetical protein DI628_01065 [Blastochloris viridis]
MAENTQNLIDTSEFARGYRTRFHGGASDRTWMPDNVTAVIHAVATDRVLILHERKPGMVLRFAEDYAPERPHSIEVDVATGPPIFLAEDEVLTLPSGSIKNNWEGKPDNIDALVYEESPEQAVLRQLKGETGKYLEDVNIIKLGGTFVKPANMTTFDAYFAIQLPSEFVPATEGIDPTIKGGHWVPFDLALQLVDSGLINHDPAAQALMRYERYLRKNG